MNEKLYEAITLKTQEIRSNTPERINISFEISKPLGDTLKKFPYSKEEFNTLIESLIYLAFIDLDLCNV